MYLAYMDECGNTGTNADPDQPIHFLGCLIVEDVAVRPLEEAVRAIAAKYFPEKHTEPKFEFHGVDLYAGKGLFKGSAPQARIDATTELIAAAREHGKFGFTGVDKIKSYANAHPHRICFTLLAERLEAWLKSKDSLALLVSDENQEVEQDIIRDIHTFKTSTTQWGYRRVPITRVIDSVHFVKSHNNPAIQVADVLTYLIQKEVLTARRVGTDWEAITKDIHYSQWPSYQAWLPAQRSKAEVATKALVDSMDWHFCSKIWPD
jgi:hypothetical protein